MKRYLKHIFILACGLMCFQVIASVGVHLSNMDLARFMTAAIHEGYLTVPNTRILDGLQSPGLAMAGGLFFTLSIGALISLVSLGASALYLGLPAHGKSKAVAFLTVPVLALILINLNGFLFFESAACTLSPALIYFLYRRIFKHDPPALSLKTAGHHGAPPLILGLVLLAFFSGQDSRIFSDFRDTFLMSNPVGMAINDFYYTNTLSPAEVFKSMDMKLIKQGSLIMDSPDDLLKKRLEHELLLRDYLILDHESQPDLTLRYQTDQLFFYHDSHLVFSRSVQEVLADPNTSFKAFSDATDTYAQYRKITGIGLVTGLPLLMYLTMHGIFFLVAALFISPTQSARIASALCLILGLCAFGFLRMHSPETMDLKTIQSSLSSDSPAIRTAALHYITDEKLDISRYSESRSCVSSSFVPERYWYARASAFSRHNAPYTQLLTLLDDPQPNVRCQAFFALGVIGNRRAVPEIIRRIKVSDHWYVQWYAYRALKRLGWIQKKSKA